MINAKFKITIDTARIRDLQKAQVQALEMTAEALHTEVVQAQVFPRRSGNLQNESTHVDATKSSQGKASIVSVAPYARRLYFHPEYNFWKEANPNAKGLWYEDWLPGGAEESFCREAFKDIIRRCAGL